MMPPDDTGIQLAAQAMAALQQGHLDQAEQLCLRVLSLSADDANALHLLALVYKRADRLAQSLVFFERVLALHAHAPFLPTVRGNYGNTLKEAGRHYEALEQYRLALEQSPDSAGMYNNMGNAYKDLCLWPQAEQAYQRALALDPLNADTLNNLGGVALNAGRHQDAVQLFRQVLQIDPDHAQACYNLGNALQDLSDFQGAGSESCGSAFLPGQAQRAVLRLGRAGWPVSAHDRAGAGAPGWPHLSLCLSFGGAIQSGSVFVRP
jgi:tetratricopeptide (TPR) repeat protein